MSTKPSGRLSWHILGPVLTVFGRQLLIARVEAGWPAAHVAEQLGVSRTTAYKWIRRHRAEGTGRSRGPLVAPTALTTSPGSCRGGRDPPARTQWRYGFDRLGPLLGRPPSTVHRVLVRRGLSRLRDADRVTTAPIRYVACHLGALVQQDHKRLGRIPDGGGWRAVGQSTEVRRRKGSGYEHLEVVIDDASRYAVVVPVPDETVASAVLASESAAAELARHGVRLERVLFDIQATWASAYHVVGRPWKDAEVRLPSAIAQ